VGINGFYKILQNGALRTSMEPPHGREPRASLIVIAGTLSMFHIPEAGLLLLLGIDQVLDMGRSATNVFGNSIA
jgi:hypothetical protein